MELDKFCGGGRVVVGMCKKIYCDLTLDPPHHSSLLPPQLSNADMKVIDGVPVRRLAAMEAAKAKSLMRGASIVGASAAS